MNTRRRKATEGELWRGAAQQHRASGIERRAEGTPLRVRCDLLVRGASELVTMSPDAGPAAPAGAVDLGVIPRGAVAARDGRVVWTGPEADIAGALEVPGDALVVDVEGAAVLPGLVDAHAHVVWAGERAAEYGARLAGTTYLEVQAAGGGINSTVRATRAATEEQLAALTARRLDSFVRHGTTTVEMKTGYGLTLEDERKQLNAAKVAHPANRVHTVLAAHLTPEEYAGRDDEYLDLVIEEILPALAGQAEFTDVFCDEGAFTVAQSRRVLEAGRALGYRLKIHAEELARTGGTALAAELGAVSADHLIHITGEDIAALRASGTVAVLLPGTSYTLHTTFAPARELLEAGVTIALATDFNPGSCYSENLQMAISLACQEDRLTPAEALRAVTMGGAAALGLQHEVGSLEVGKRCDLIVLDSASHQELPYHWGVNLVTGVIAGGEIVVRDRALVPPARNVALTTPSPAAVGGPA